MIIITSHNSREKIAKRKITKNIREENEAIKKQRDIASDINYFRIITIKLLLFTYTLIHVSTYLFSFIAIFIGNHSPRLETLRNKCFIGNYSAVLITMLGELTTEFEVFHVLGNSIITEERGPSSSSQQSVDGKNSVPQRHTQKAAAIAKAKMATADPEEENQDPADLDY